MSEEMDELIARYARDIQLLIAKRVHVPLTWVGLLDDFAREVQRITRAQDPPRSVVFLDPDKPIEAMDKHELIELIVSRSSVRLSRAALYVHKKRELLAMLYDPDTHF